MFFYATSSRFKFNLKLHNLGECNPMNQSWLDTASQWSESKWGYLRKFPGIAERKRLIENVAEQMQIYL